MTSHFIFVHCLTHYSWASNTWTFVEPTSSSTSTMECTSKISSALPSISKSAIPISLTIIPILTTNTIVILRSVISLHIVKLSATSTSIESSSPSWRSYLRFPRFIRSISRICRRQFIEPYLHGAHVLCCPMENTLGSLDTLADPGTASLILGFENKSIKKDFKSFNFL